MLINKRNCITKYTHWDDKSVLLGAILYLSKNFKTTKMRSFVVNHKKIRIILRTMFKDYVFVKKPAGDSIHINIFNTERNGLVINYLDNLSDVRARKIRKLPWYNAANPVVMYVHNDKYPIYDLQKFKQKLKNFSRTKRLKHHMPANNIICKCSNVNTWDCFYEYKILNYYSRKYRYNMQNIYNYITMKLMNNSFAVAQQKYLMNNMQSYMNGNNNMLINQLTQTVAVQKNQIKELQNNFTKYNIKYRILQKMANDKKMKIEAYEKDKKAIKKKLGEKNIDYKKINESLLAQIKKINDFLTNNFINSVI